MGECQHQEMLIVIILIWNTVHKVIGLLIRLRHSLNNHLCVRLWVLSHQVTKLRLHCRFVIRIQILQVVPQVLSHIPHYQLIITCMFHRRPMFVAHSASQGMTHANSYQNQISGNRGSVNLNLVNSSSENQSSVIQNYGNQGSGPQGSGNSGSGNLGSGGQRSSNLGSDNQGSGTQGSGNQGAARQDQGISDNSIGNDRTTLDKPCNISIRFPVYDIGDSTILSLQPLKPFLNGMVWWKKLRCVYWSVSLRQHYIFTCLCLRKFGLVMLSLQLFWGNFGPLYLVFQILMTWMKIMVFQS